MKFAFFGTPEFAAIILEHLVKSGLPPALVVTNSDKPIGRKKIIAPPPVKVLALKYEIPVFQPESLKTKNPLPPAAGGAFGQLQNDPIILMPGLPPAERVANLLKKSSTVDKEQSRGPAGNRTPEALVANLTTDHPGPTMNQLYHDKWDFFLVASYGKIIPKDVLSIPRLGVVNVHPSLLPKYRGPTPIQSAILNGEEKTGVSLIFLDEEVDHGPVLKKQELRIKNQGYETLARDLAALGAELLIDTLPKFLKGEVKPTAQDHAKATFTKKFTPDDAFVKYDDLAVALSGASPRDALRIDRMIRALNPEPGVWTRTNNSPFLNLPKNKRIKLLAAEISSGKLRLKQIQVEGKKPRLLH